MPLLLLEQDGLALGQRAGLQLDVTPYRLEVTGATIPVVLASVVACGCISDAAPSCKLCTGSIGLILDIAAIGSFALAVFGRPNCDNLLPALWGSVAVAALRLQFCDGASRGKQGPCGFCCTSLCAHAVRAGLTLSIGRWRALGQGVG